MDLRSEPFARRVIGLAAVMLFLVLAGLSPHALAQPGDPGIHVNARATAGSDAGPYSYTDETEDGNWYGGIWKNSASSPEHSVNLYIQSYYTGSAVVVYTPDASVFYAFLAETADSGIEADSMDPGKSRSLRIDFDTEDTGTLVLTDNTQDPPSSIEVDIERVFKAVRTAHSGIWKDPANVFNMYVQDYETGSTVVVYTFDGAGFQAFLSDTDGSVFSGLNLSDQTKEIIMTFMGWDEASVIVQPPAASSYLPAASGFDFEVTKPYPPARMDVDFEGSPRAGSGPLEVAFSDTSALENTQWSWDFGDGTSSTEQNPTHVYSTPGKYTVRLETSDGTVRMLTTRTDYIEVFASTDPVISGTVRESYASNGLKGVTVTLSGVGTDVTDATGYYAVQVPSGWTGIMGPSLSGWLFAPRNISLSNVTTDQAGQDFLGSYMPANMINISGKVHFGGTGFTLGPVQLDFSGVGTCFADALGNYSYDVPGPWTGTVTPSLSGYFFGPASRSYTALASGQTNQDFSAFTSPPAMVTIAGTIRTAGGTPMLGVVVNYSGVGGAGTATLDIQGKYSFQVLSGWSGTATPSRSGYVFNPASRTYTNQTTDAANHDYTGSMNLSGTITFGATGLSGVTVTVSDVGIVTTDASGHYSVDVPPSWTGTVTPSLSGYIFIPEYKSYPPLTSSQTNQDFEAFVAPPPMITVSGTVVLTGTGSPMSGISITYSGVGGAGTATTDYQGNYSFQVLSGWSGTATPSDPKYSFYPPSRMYNSETADISNHDYTATQTIVSIVGNVTTGTGTPLPLVDVNYSGDGISGVISTASWGGYSFDVPYGWSGTATPTKSGYSFSPSVRTYTAVSSDLYNQDYTGTQSLPQTVAVTGTITYSGDYLSGVTVAFTGLGQTTTDYLGHYYMAVPYQWSGTVTPSLEGYTFSPEYRNYSGVTTDQTGQNYTASQALPQTVTISGTTTFFGDYLSGVTVAFTGLGQTTTNYLGYYSMAVPYLWYGTVTPSLEGYTFSPEYRNYSGVATDQTGQNFTASQTLPQTVVLSGTITGPEYGAPAPGITVSFTGQGSVVTDYYGQYYKEVPLYWSGYITPYYEGYGFSPSNYTLPSVSSDQYGLDFVAYLDIVW